MLKKEAYFPEFEFKVTPMDYTEEVKAMPDVALLTVVCDAINLHYSCSTTLHVTDPGWKSGDTSGTQTTRKFFEACKSANYKCVDGR